MPGEDPGSAPASADPVATVRRCCCDSDQLYVGFLLTLVLLLNFGLNFVNKWAMTPEPMGLGYSYPMFQGCCDSTISLVSMSILGMLVPGLVKVSWAQFWKLKLQLTALALLFAISIVANNASLVKIGLSVNQVIKGCVPLPTVICSYFLEGKRYSWRVVASVTVLVIGSAMAIPFNRPSASPDGLVLALAAMLAAAVKASLSALLMNNTKSEGLTPLALTFYQAAIAAPTLLLVWLLSSEPPDTIAYLKAKPMNVFFIVASISLMATVYNVVVYTFTQVTSALTLTISGSIKLVVLIVVPAIFMDKEDSLLNWIGTGLFFAALFYYSYLGYLRKTGFDEAGEKLPEKEVEAATGGSLTTGERLESAPASETTPLQSEEARKASYQGRPNPV